MSSDDTTDEIPWPDLPAGVTWEPAGEPVVLEGPELMELLGFGPHVPEDAIRGLAPPAHDDPLWWLSFCDPSKTPPLNLQRPGGPSFLGAVITQAPTLAAAITRSHMLGVNPGGEIGSVGPIPAAYIGADWRDRLLTAAEAEAIPEPEGL